MGWGANHFAALLAVYRQRLALDAAAPTLLFGVYALGLMPGLLFAGPLSDRRGRRPLVLPAAAAALAASCVLGGFGHSFPALLGGRFLYGLAAGAVTSPGSVWLFELSRDVAPAVSARRAAVALSAGFGSGPLVTGALAQFAPAPTLAPFAVHAAVLTFALLRALPVAETVTTGAAAAAPGAALSGSRTKPAAPLLRFDLDGASWRRFCARVLPMAPWVFAFPSISFAVLPGMFGGALGPAPIALTGLIGAVTLGSGVLAQPLARTLAPERVARRGLLVGAVGLCVGGLAVQTATAALLFVAAPLLGAAYGICLTAGLRASQAIAPPHARGGLTGLYYVLTYLGFAAPYLFALAGHLWAAPISFAISAALAAAIAAALPSPSHHLSLPPPARDPPGDPPPAPPGARA